jgi:hypothetical protein
LLTEVNSNELPSGDLGEVFDQTGLAHTWWPFDQDWLIQLIGPQELQKVHLSGPRIERIGSLDLSAHLGDLEGLHTQMSLSGNVWEAVIVDPGLLHPEHLVINLQQELVTHLQDLGLLPIPRNIDA